MVAERRNRLHHVSADIRWPDLQVIRFQKIFSLVVSQRIDVIVERFVAVRLEYIAQGQEH
jgi:hypothetical protein